MAPVESASAAFLLAIVLVAFSTGEKFSIDDGAHSPFPDDFKENADLLHRIFTKGELATFDGKNAGPIYMAVKGIVFDVTSAREFYGPGHTYHKLTGKDASRAIATGSMEEDELNDNLDGLTTEQLNSLENTFNTVYMAKYPVVGYLQGHEPVEENTTFRRRKVEL